MPISTAIEDRWGLRVSEVRVTADGGLVDFRFFVIDPDKALGMLSDLKNAPVMIAESNGALINSTALMAHKHGLRAGQTVYMLYRNTGGALKRGGFATVVFGELRLEHVPVK